MCASVFNRQWGSASPTRLNLPPSKTTTTNIGWAVIQIRRQQERRMRTQPGKIYTISKQRRHKRNTVLTRQCQTMQLRHLGRESRSHHTVPKQCIQSAISRGDLFVGDLFAQAVPSNDRTAVPRQSRQQAARIIAIDATGHPIYDFAKVLNSSERVTNSVRACTTDASCVLAMNSSSVKQISELVDPPEVLMKLSKC